MMTEKERRLAQWTCTKCGRKVSQRRRHNQLKRDDGWDHVLCDARSDAVRLVSLRDRREHRDAVRIAVIRDGKLQ